MSTAGVGSGWWDRVSQAVTALAFGLYGWALWRYCVNVPYWDDFSVILEPLSRVFAGQGWRENWRVLFTPNAGHLPLLTHLVSALQVTGGGAVDFRQSALLANTGWLTTVVVLMAYYRRHLQLPWFALLPIPLLLLSITHWEAMDFTTPAWQMYWGSALLPVLCLLAAVRGHGVLAALAFGLALFFSSGALALVPLVLACSVHGRDWRGGVAFVLLAVLILAVFFFCNPPAAQQVVLPGVAAILRYLPAFMGNVVGTGSWYLGSATWLHWPLGWLVLFAGWRYLRPLRSAGFSQLLFAYVLLLACMATYLRGGGYGYVVSRYSLFALLGLTALYTGCVAPGWHEGEAGRRRVMAAVAVAVLLWSHSYYSCLQALANNRALRLDVAHRYLQGGELGKLLWDEAYGQRSLRQARASGVFDTEVWRDLPVQ